MTGLGNTIESKESIKDRIDRISDNANLSMNTKYTTCKIEISGICNLNCSFCYEKELRKSRKRQKFMLLDDLKLVLDVLEDKVSTIKEIGLFYMGEPGLNPALPELAKECKDRGYFVFLTTNGIITNTIVEAIPYIDSLKLSWNYKNIDDFDKKTNIGENSKSSIYKMIQVGSERMYNACHKYGKTLACSTVLAEDDKKEDYAEALSQLYFDEHYWIPMQSQAGYIDALDGVVGEYDKQSNPIPCWSLFKGVYIDADFNIRTCCYGHDDSCIMGNIKTNPNFDKNEIKLQHLNGNIPKMCKKCLKHSK